MAFVQPSWSSIFASESISRDIEMPSPDWYKGPGWYESNTDWYLIEKYVPDDESRLRVHCWYGRDPREDLLETVHQSEYTDEVRDSFFTSSLRPSINGRLGGLLTRRARLSVQILAEALDRFITYNVDPFQGHQLKVVHRTWRAFIRELQMLVTRA